MDLTILHVIVFCALLALDFGYSTGAGNPACPIHCQCVPNRMSCELPGLKRLPAPYMSTLENLHVENQTFDSTHLGMAELRAYRTPKFGGQIHLKSLYIRSCNIRTIGRHAFQEIGSKLTILDLSGNPLRRVGDYAFAGLGHLTLILDKIDVPVFEEHAFSGLAKMKSLMMQHSKLETLPYEALLHLTSEKNLDKLLVKGNAFRTLDSKFDAIFGAVQYFNINENMWHCDCQLNWLIRRYQALLHAESLIDKTRQRRWDDTLKASTWVQEDIQPQCASPPLLAGRNFSDLITDINAVYTSTLSRGRDRHPPTVLHCPPPKLESFDINLEDYENPQPSTNHSSQSHTSPNRPSVQLKCVMKGSKQLSVAWRYHDPENGFRIIADNSVIRAQKRLFQDTHLWAIRSEEAVFTESSVRVGPNEVTDTYSCFGQDVIGNVSTLLRIQWPSKSSTITSLHNVISSQTSQRNPKHVLPTEWTSDIAMSSHSVLHAPRFSLSQLLGAITGTFLSTVLLFFVIHITLHWERNVCGRHKRGDRKKIVTGTTGSLGVSPGGTSSSSTSCLNPKLVSPPKPSEAYSTCTPLHLNPESLSITANLLNAHAYHQLMNGAPGLGYTALPIEGGTMVPNSNTQLHQTHHPSIQPTNPTLPESGVSTMSAGYEPVSYSDANLTYDVPWIVNSVNRSYQEQHIPLLFSSLTNNSVQHADRIGPLPNSHAIQSAFMIPPPPSIPQPSLPATPNSVTLNGTLHRTPSTATNLLVLQAAFPPTHSTKLSTGSVCSNEISDCSGNHSTLPTSLV